MKIHALIIAAIGAGIAAPLIIAAPANAATAGDTVIYTWCSDVPDNSTSTWYDADNDIAQFENTHLPTYFAADGRFCGHQTVVSASTYQLTASSLQTDGLYSACTIRVNGELVASNAATGRYAISECAA